MNEREELVEASGRIAAAIGRRDLETVRSLLTTDFVHRTHGGPGVDLETFLEGIKQIPGEILLVRIEHLEIDLTAAGALVTGTQYARVRIDGQVVDDRRGFVDWFVKQDGRWRLQAAVALPPPQAE